MYKIIKDSNIVLGSCMQENLIKLFNFIDELRVVTKAVGNLRHFVLS